MLLRSNTDFLVVVIFYFISGGLDAANAIAIAALFKPLEIFEKIGIFGILDFYWSFGFWISDFFIFIEFLALSREQKELLKFRWCQKDRSF